MALDGLEYRIDVSGMIARRTAGRGGATPVRRVAVSLRQSVGHTAVGAAERLDVHSNDQLGFYQETERSADTINHGDRIVLPAAFLQASLDLQDNHHMQEQPCYRIVHRDQCSQKEVVCFGWVRAYGMPQRIAAVLAVRFDRQGPALMHVLRCVRLCTAGAELLPTNDLHWFEVMRAAIVDERAPRPLARTFSDPSAAGDHPLRHHLRECRCRCGRTLVDTFRKFRKCTPTVLLRSFTP